MSTAPKFDIWSPEYQDDLYLRYKTLRDQYPVFEYESDSNEFSKCWLLSRFDDVRDTFRDKVNFKNAETRNDIIPQLQSSDGDLHKGIRSQVFPKLVMSAINHIEPYIEKTVIELLDAVEANGGCELAHEVAFEVPRRVVPELLGFPDEMAERMVDLVDPLAGYDPLQPRFPEPTLGDAVIDLINELFAYKKAHPGDDLMTELIALEEAGELVEGGTVLAARSFAFAAYDTTINLLANGTVLLADNPLQRQKLIDQPELMSQAIDEMLRMESPTQMIPRRVQREVELHHQKLAVGDEVLLLVGAANLDERHFNNANEFDIEREVQDHLSFGSGIHTCVGRHFAKLEASVYFKYLLERFPRYQIGTRRYKASGWSRSFAEVQFTCV
jgi:cytochrome P450